MGLSALSFTHDYHIHTRHSPDVKIGSFRDYSTIAERNRIHIGFLDHFKIWKFHNPTYPLSEERIQGYLKEFDEVRSEFSNISLGLEVDYHPEIVNALEEFLDDHREEFDRFIGAIHVVFGELVSTVEGLKKLARRHPLEIICDEYFRLVKMAVESRLFDGIAHLDGVYRWMRRANLTPRVDRENILELGRLCRTRRVKVELNIRSHYRRTSPPKPIVRKLLEEKTIFFIGSDSHSPEEFLRTVNRIKHANKFIWNSAKP